MADPYFGGPRPLAARERLVTPKDTPPAKAPPPQRGQKGPTVTAFKGNPAKPIRRSAPAFKGEQPAGYTPTPQYGKFGQIGFNKPFNQQKPYYQVKPDTRSGIEQAVDRQVTPLLAKGNKVASSKLTTPLTVAGNVLAQASGGPVALDALNAARKGNVGAAAVDVAGLLPVGRLGRLVKGAEAGLRAAQEEPAIVRAARAVGKVKPAEAKALQVVHEGVPIEQRIAEAKAAGAKDEVKALQAAKRHVHDVAVPLTERERIFADVIAHPDKYVFHGTPSEDAARSIESHGIEAGTVAGHWSHTLDYSRGGYITVFRKSDFAHGFEPNGQKPVAVFTHRDFSTEIPYGHRAQELGDNPDLPGESNVFTKPSVRNYVGSGFTGSAMPRINPGNHKLVDVYAKAERKLKANPPTGQEIVRGAMKGARVQRGKQEVMYSQERTARVAAASKYLNDPTLPPEERLARAKNELKGELPKINFQGFNELNDQSIKALQEHILNHPHLMPFQKIRAADALTKALSGQVPQKSELTLLEHVFGKETANGIGKIPNHPYKDLLLNVLNVPRSVMASFDLSAPFRQGLVVGTRHPGIFFRNFKPMIKAFGSERVYDSMLNEIQSRPTYPMMVEAKLAITRLSKDVGPREEQFASDMAERIPGVGHGIRASGRAYTGFLDKTRADVFDHLVQRAQQQGINVQDEKFLKDLGRYINAATGRGNLPGHLQGAAKALNTLFFSPRLLASRLDLLFSPASYARADPFVRKEALRSMVQLAGTASTLLALASQIPGAKVVTDPRNPDWGKIKIGNTRIDIGGGFQQPLRLFAQLATGTAISSTTGKKLNLTANGFGQPTRLDLFLRFFEGKESPWASVATDWLRNSNQIGQKFSWGSEAAQHLTPLIAQDAYDLYNNRHGGLNGLAAAFAGYGIESVGFGLQTYGPKKPKASGSGDPYFSGGGSTSSDPYFGGPSGGASDPYFGSAP